MRFLCSTISARLFAALDPAPSFSILRAKALCAASRSFFAARASFTSFFTAFRACPTRACAFLSSTRAASASASSFSRAASCCTSFFSSAASASKISCARFFLRASRAPSAARANAAPSFASRAIAITSTSVAFSFARRFVSVIVGGTEDPAPAPATRHSRNRMSPKREEITSLALSSASTAAPNVTNASFAALLCVLSGLSLLLKWWYAKTGKTPLSVASKPLSGLFLTNACVNATHTCANFDRGVA
mmetsp:Transcript_7823/g.32671  ORF Transcript_7823/g.32671 Transcript_7823/m.32671 type:complete len:248 (-) Transcript_7823:1436-2179(-)